MPDIQHRCLGRRAGNFDPDQPDTLEWVDLLDKHLMASANDPQSIFYPRCGFTTRIVMLGVEDNQITPGFLNTRMKADGVVIDKPHVAGVIFNADCPVITIFEPNRNRFAMLHAGFRCLLPAVDLRGKRPRGIIRSAFEDLKFDVNEIRIWVGMGIGPCCYGAEHWPEMNDPSVDIPIAKATRGPRKGKRSIDLYQLIYDQLTKQQGVKPNRIEVDAECTCCKGYSLTHFFYHSNCRSGVQAGRNLVAFWMT